MVIRQVESDADRAAVQALLREAFEVQPGVGGAFAQLYLDVITKTSANSYVAVIDGQVVGHALLALRMFVIDGVHLPGGFWQWWRSLPNIGGVRHWQCVGRRCGESSA